MDAFPHDPTRNPKQRTLMFVEFLARRCAGSTHIVGFKIRFPKGSGGSIPPPGTKLELPFCHQGYRTASGSPIQMFGV